MSLPSCHGPTQHILGGEVVLITFGESLRCFFVCLSMRTGRCLCLGVILSLYVSLGILLAWDLASRRHYSIDGVFQGGGAQYGGGGGLWRRIP